MKLIRPALVLLLGSLWAPAVWALIIVGNASEYNGGLFSARYFDGFVLFPLLMTWAGAMPVAVSIWLLHRSVGEWVVPAGVVSLVLSVGLIFVVAWLSLPSDSYIWSSPSSSDVRNSSFVLSGLIAAFSLPVWIHLGIVHLVRWLRSLRAPV